jgi:hypothetical protein
MRRMLIPTRRAFQEREGARSFYISGHAADRSGLDEAEVASRPPVFMDLFP